MASQNVEFLRATAISIGVIGFPPSKGLKWRSHSSLNSPMLRYTRFKAPSAPTESDPSLSTRGVNTVAGGVKNAAKGDEAGT